MLHPQTSEVFKEEHNIAPIFITDKYPYNNIDDPFHRTFDSSSNPCNPSTFLH